MSVGSLSFFSVSVLRIHFFLIGFSDKEGLFSSLLRELPIDAISLSTCKASMKFSARVIFCQAFTNMAMDGGKAAV
jgi:hypothetical protein